MKNSGTQTFALNSMTVLVRAALAVMCGMSTVAFADDDANQQVRPTSFVEIGAMNVSSNSNKFGEYNGLDQSGAYAIGNFGVKGGSAYDAYDGGEGTMRWEANGANLGTTSRSLDASVGNQGSWSFGVMYDEMRHYTSEPFITPLQGSMGGNSFVLPADFGQIRSNTAPGTRGLTVTQKSEMRTIDDLYSGRKNIGANGLYRFNSQWSVDFEINRLTQTGAKLIASGTNQQAAGSAGAVANNAVGEAITMLMNPTNYQTDSVKLAVNWTGDRGHLTVGYYGSFFRDDYSTLSWSNPYVSAGATGTARVFPTDTLSTAPNNDFHQLNVSGGYKFGPTTKVAGGMSYGRNTQNQAFFNDTALMAGALPATSLEGAVVTTNANLKLTDSSIKDLNLSAGFKFNERDNQTRSNVYNFYDIGHSNLRTIANAPYSNKKTQFELAGDYLVAKRQNIRLSYERENIERWCNDLAKNPNGAPCVVVGSSYEDKLNARYRLKLDGGVSLNVGYGYADRHANEDHRAVTPIGVTTYGYVNGGDAVGYKPYFDASRRQNMLKIGASWDVTEKFTLTADGRAALDRYYDSPLGVSDGTTMAVNLDASYTFAEERMLGAYVSLQSMTRDMNVASTVSTTNGVGTNVWSNRLTDRQNAVGLYGKWGGLMGGKLSFKGDLSWSNGLTNYYTGSYPANSSTCGTSGTLTCGDTPDVKSNITTVKLEGNYQVDKSSKVRLGYVYQQLKSNDYVYNIYQMGYTPNATMPSNQQAANYSVNVLMASYIYSFQ
uniref:MtrB/PioB family decaheme-associated outer membrane protein n=1 Tax=Dechloromonas aromatica (strain RCB) TaxID=159087 RepID=Q47G79_DECAR